MRRNRRKLAAQLLDQQLSQAVDEALTKANIPPPPPPRARQLPAIPAPTPVLSTGLLSAEDTLRRSSRSLSTSTELPLPHFTDFGLSILPHISPSSSTPPPVRSPTPFRTLPAWCPKIPSLTLGDVWRECLPTFFDLSALPEIADGQAGAEKTEPKNAECRDMQVWRPIGVGFGREQSRFFPSRYLRAAEEDDSVVTCKARVRLPPPVGCTLHASDSGPKSVESSSGTLADADEYQPLHQTSQPTTPKHEPAAQTFEHDATEKIIDEASTSNAWRILTVTPSIRSPTVELDNRATTQNIAYSATNATQYAIAQYPSSVDDCPPPYELDGHEVTLPYVHANALTGYSNGSTTTAMPYCYDERRSPSDSGIGLPVVRLSEDYNVGLNELMVNNDDFYRTMPHAAAVPLPKSLPATPFATPPTRSVGDLAAILSVDCVTENEQQNSDAHFRSEQALFLQSPPSQGQDMPKSDSGMDHSSINIADFLKLGHAKHCWCGGCTDEPYYVTADEAACTSSASVVHTAESEVADQEYDDSTLSLVIHPSESEPDCELEALDDANPVEPSGPQMWLAKKASGSVEEDGWLFFHSSETGDHPPSSSTPYLPSSPVLHRQRTNAPTPTIIITSSDSSSQDRSDDYVAVASPTIASPASSGTGPSWLDRVPRRPSSAWEAGLAAYGDEGIGCGFAKALESSWRWGMEDDEEWWDWAVEDDC